MYEDARHLSDPKCDELIATQMIIVMLFVLVTINGYTWRNTVGNRDGIQYIVVNANARRVADSSHSRYSGLLQNHAPDACRYVVSNSFFRAKIV